jgi:hypothetical protein
MLGEVDLQRNTKTPGPARRGVEPARQVYDLLVAIATGCVRSGNLGPQTGSVCALQPPVRNIFLYETREFLGSARVSIAKCKRLASGATGAMRAGEILKPTDLERLELDPATAISIT